MNVTFSDIIDIRVYPGMDYTDIIGDPRGDDDNPCYLTLGLARHERLSRFHDLFMLRKYFDIWYQLRTNPLIDYNDCSD